jgi:hypothetical protein
VRDNECEKEVMNYATGIAVGYVWFVILASVGIGLYYGPEEDSCKAKGGEYYAPFLSRPVCLKPDAVISLE